MNFQHPPSLAIWTGEYCDLPLYFVLVRKYAPEQPPTTYSPPIQHVQQPNPPLSRRSSIVSGVSASAQNLFRKRKPAAFSPFSSSSVTATSTPRNPQSNFNSFNNPSRDSFSLAPTVSQDLAYYIYQLILGLPNAYRDRFNSPFPITVEDYMDSLIRLLPKEWPDLASSSALRRLTALHYSDFASFQHFLWEFRRLKLVSQCPDRKAFLIFLAIIPIDLRVAISRSGINQYSQLARVEEYDKIDTKLTALDPRCRKPLRMDIHKDRLLFALHLPSTLFNRISKSKHKLIDSLAMSWFQLSTSSNAFSNSLHYSSYQQHQLSKNFMFNTHSVPQSTNTSVSSAPSYLYESSGTKTLPFAGLHSFCSVQSAGNNNIFAPSTNQNHLVQPLPNDEKNASYHQEVVISDSLVYFNQRIHLSQSLISSVIKHWYNCFTADMHQADVHIFNSLTSNSFSFKPIFDFSKTLYSKPAFNPISNQYSTDSVDSAYGDEHLEGLFNNIDLNDSLLVSAPSPPSNAAYYKSWQVVKISYVSGADLLKFYNSGKKPSRSYEKPMPMDKPISRPNSRLSSHSRESAFSNFPNNRHSYYSSNVNISRADSKTSSSSAESSNGPSLFSYSDSIQDSESSYTTNSTSPMNASESEHNDPCTAKGLEKEAFNEASFQLNPKDFLILTCCETLQVFLAPVDPTDPPLAVIQTTLIPFAHQYGYPLALMTDRSAPNCFFTSNLFQSFWKSHGTSTFHQNTISSDATSIAALNIDFVKTYLACFFKELQNDLSKANGVDNDVLSCFSQKPAGNNSHNNQQHSFKRMPDPAPSYSRTVDMAGCTKRLMAALNDFIAFYDTNGCSEPEESLSSGSTASSRTSSPGSPIHKTKPALSLGEQPCFNREHQTGSSKTVTSPSESEFLSNISPRYSESRSRTAGSGSDLPPSTQVERSKSITKATNTRASFTLYEENEVFPEFSLNHRNSIKYCDPMSPEDFGKKASAEASGDSDEEGSGMTETGKASNEVYDQDAFFVTNGYRDTIFYRTLATAMKLFTDVTKMHSSRCARVFESSIEPDLIQGQASWATVIPWKLNTQQHQQQQNNIESKNLSAPAVQPASLHSSSLPKVPTSSPAQSINTPAVPVNSKRLSSNLSKYCNYYESLGQQNQAPGTASCSSPRSFLQNNSSRESIESTNSSVGLNSISIPSYASNNISSTANVTNATTTTTTPITTTNTAILTTSTPSMLRDHVIIKDKITAVVSVLGYCEYLGIPCFLVQTDSQHAPGVAWVTGYQFTPCSDQLRSAIHSVCKSSSQEAPFTLRYLFSLESPRVSPQSPVAAEKTRREEPAKNSVQSFISTKPFQNANKSAFELQHLSKKHHSSYTHLKRNNRSKRPHSFCSSSSISPSPSPSPSPLLSPANSNTNPKFAIPRTTALSSISGYSPKLDSYLSKSEDQQADSSTHLWNEDFQLPAFCTLTS